tara:strand:- start:11849 stop:13528 length:1680 start_codon:yes stop_codon:yes gene_type:complete
MPRTLNFQTNFVAGVLDPRLAARTDIQQYYQGVEEGTNVLNLPQGGLKRRPGMAYQATLAGSSRIVMFAFNVEQTYLIAFSNNNIAVYKDGVHQANVTSTYTTAQLFELNWTQSADTMIIVHPDHQPAKLVRGGSHTSWTLSNITLTNIPTFDYGAGAEAVLSATRGWPRTTTFFAQRLWFGGSKSRPQTIWASVIGDFYNLNVGTGLNDDALDFTLDTDQVNAIEAIYAGRHLSIFTSGGEFYMPDSPITPTKSAVQRQTQFGSSAIRPVGIDGGILFVDRAKAAVREFLFTYEEDAYTSNSKTLMASHLISAPVDMDARRGTPNEDANYVYIVNDDGTMAVFNTLRDQGIAGWTKWSTTGSIESVAVIVDDVYFSVKRSVGGGDVYYLEKADNNTYTDANKLQTLSPASASVSGLAHLNGIDCRVRADNSIMANATPSSGAITLSRTATTVEVGMDYDTTIKTMPLNMDFQDGPILTRHKRLVRVVADVYQSLGLYVNSTLVPDRLFGTSILGTTPTAFTGIKEMHLLGWDRLAQVTITQQDPQPLTLLGLAVEVEA